VEAEEVNDDGTVVFDYGAGNDQLRGGVKEAEDVLERFRRLEPLTRRVIVKSDGATDLRTKSGIVLAQSEKEVPQQGIIVAVAEDSLLDIDEGDDVIYSRYAGANVKVGQETYLIIDEKDLLAVYRDGAPVGHVRPPSVLEKAVAPYSGGTLIVAAMSIAIVFWLGVYLLYYYHLFIFAK
jgi:chaperonin GroES